MSVSILPSLRDYQQILYEKIRAAYATRRSVLAVAPTGAGKGALITYIVGRAVSSGTRVVFLVNRRELIRDMSRRLDKLGIDHGVIMGASTRRAWLPVQVVSIDSLRKRELPKCGLCVIDEAHYAVSPSWMRVIERYREAGARFLLTTATPIRLDGRGLGAIAEVLVEGPSVSELTERGYLVPARVFAPSVPDLTGVHSSGGDFNQTELAAMMDNSRLVGDVVENWRIAGRGRPTVAFCVNRSHSEHLAAKFQAAGVTALHVDANTPDAERDATWRKLADGRVQVVCSVGIISFGWDVPACSCAILARPTQSLALHLQQCGRVLRPHPGKPDAIILDHAGNTLRHGFVDDAREWTLKDKQKRKRCDDAKMPEHALPRVCPQCFRVAKPKAKLCACGYVFAVSIAREITESEGQLLEITDKQAYVIGDYVRAAGADSQDIGVQRIIQNASARGWKPGSVHMQKRALFEARDRYRAALGSEPKPHWTVAAMNSILEIQSKRIFTPEAK